MFHTKWKLNATKRRIDCLGSEKKKEEQANEIRREWIKKRRQPTHSHIQTTTTTYTHTRAHTRSPQSMVTCTQCTQHTFTEVTDRCDEFVWKRSTAVTCMWPSECRTDRWWGWCECLLLACATQITNCNQCVAPSHTKPILAVNPFGPP